MTTETMTPTDQTTPELPAEVREAIAQKIGETSCSWKFPLEGYECFELADALAPLWDRLRVALEERTDQYNQAAERAERAEAELAESRQYRTGHLPTCAGMDFETMRCGCGYLDGTAYRELVAERDQFRAEVERMKESQRRYGELDESQQQTITDLRAQLADAQMNLDLAKSAAKKYAEECQQIAEAVGTPFAPFRNVLERVKEYQSRIAAAQEDKERLKILEDNAAEVRVEWDDGEAPIPPEFSIIVKGTGIIGRGPTLRAAIDAARKENTRHA